jgi:hypothetical protein
MSRIFLGAGEIDNNTLRFYIRVTLRMGVRIKIAFMLSVWKWIRIMKEERDG